MRLKLVVFELTCNQNNHGLLAACHLHILLFEREDMCTNAPGCIKIGNVIFLRLFYFVCGGLAKS